MACTRSNRVNAGLGVLYVELSILETHQISSTPLTLFSPRWTPLILHALGGLGDRGAAVSLRPLRRPTNQTTTAVQPKGPITERARE